MKTLFLKTLTVIAVSFFLIACGKEEDPRAVYDQFVTEVNKIESFSTKPLSKFLTKRATAKMDEGFSMIDKSPAAKRKVLETMALTMLKDTTTWLDPTAAAFNKDSDNASLKTTHIEGDNTIVTKIAFKKENGWKIDLISKDSASSDGKTKFGEYLFK